MLITTFVYLASAGVVVYPAALRPIKTESDKYSVTPEPDGISGVVNKIVCLYADLV